MTMNRRQFLAGASSLALSSATLGGLSSTLASFEAMAAPEDEYKALVCVFLLGGMDNHDTLLPYDRLSYQSFAKIRQGLIRQYKGSRDRDRLLPLSPDNASNFGGRQFALPPEMPGIANLFAQGNAAIVGNVGPLIVPATRPEVEQESVALPSRLYSHNDQQATWMASAPEGALYGWGGAFADAANAANQNKAPAFSAITTGGNDLFLTGKLTNPYQINAGEPQEISMLADEQGNNGLYGLLRSHLAAANFSSSNLVERDMARAMSDSLGTNEKYNQSIAGAEKFSGKFTGSYLGRQLGGVARTIAARNSLGVKRQVFVVGLGGFDTHAEQALNLPELHSALDSAVTEFYQAMQTLGLGQQVTLFTASDFGRTLAVNADGTDHGWGGHHFVIGDAVKGRKIYGDVPVPGFGHSLDAGSGRLIPTTSVEQMAAPMGRWFGLDETALAQALPNLKNFPGSPDLL